MIARLVDSNQTIRDEQIAILVPDKPSPNNRQTFRIRYEEYVDTRFTTPAQVMDKRVAVQGDTLQLHLRLQNAGNRRGMFKATYVVWWEAEPANLPPARITLSPLSIDFGEQAIDMPSAARTATITNVGGTPGTINLSVPDPFWQRNTCGATLAPGASCTVSVAFTPIEPGSRSAVLTLGTALPQLIVSGVGFDPPRSGSLRTEDSTDRLDWVYEPGVAARDSVTFRICLPPQLDWSKSLRVLNGNAVLVNIGVQGKNSACVSQTVPVTALSGGQTIELWKAKFLGIPVRVRHGALSEFMPLRSSSRLTFTWQKD